MKIYLIAIFYFSITFCNGQNSDKVIVHTETCNDLIAGIDNYISIIAMQDSSLTEEQVSAFLITPDIYLYEKKPIELKIEKINKKFKVHPDSSGVIEFHIKVDGKIEIETIKAKQLKAVCRLSKYKANSEVKIPIAEFRVQKGINAYIECCGFDARCKVIEFEVIRISSDELPSRTINNGARFDEQAQTLIKLAESKDIYIFRNIYYRCPSTEKQRSEDMIFEIK
ncbi:MAG: hypothetical protein DHS20C13_29390 [Thermodesulfobacteriota bacterium]|nr:MAG: hypothetical protein DHS20C13_29390 [Thermodesulfobacteriota bacterium]GJM36625.1 MAG: hypothetical protein DHS20C18_56260 [Saprospiraceae bacterium]